MCPFEIKDMAIKVVGVGSVGTFCGIVLPTIWYTCAHGRRTLRHWRSAGVVRPDPGRGRRACVPSPMGGARVRIPAQVHSRCSASPRRRSGGRTERLPREQYLAGYYQRWLGALERLVIDHGVLAPGELDAHLAGEQPTARGEARARARFAER